MFGKDGNRGLISYSKLVLGEFLRYKEFEVNIQMTIYPSIKMLSWLPSQIHRNLETTRILHPAHLCDGLLDISMIRKIPLHQAVGFATKMFSGQLHKSAFVDI